MDTETELGDAEWASGKYIYMASCLDDPIYLALRNDGLIGTAVDPPPGWGGREEGE